MSITFDPSIRLAHLENYVRNVHVNLPIEEAKIQSLRCRLVSYKLASEIGDEKLTKEYLNDIFKIVYNNLSKVAEEEVTDPYRDPCGSQYMLLDELRSYTYRDRKDPFITFIRAEFKCIFIPTLRLFTELCRSENKYSWEEVRAQLEQIMVELEVNIRWEDCEAYLEKYLKKVSPLLGLDSSI